MKRYIQSDVTDVDSLDDVLAMSKITDKIADKSITGDFGKFIYFSQAQHSSGPRIKFYGGDNNLSTKGSPYMEFDANGAGNVGGDKKTFPNLNDPEYMSKVRSFVNKFYPLLLLTWYNHLDDGDLTAYFLGKYSWEDLMDCIMIENSDFHSCKNISDVDKLCKYNNLYNFPERLN